MVVTSFAQGAVRFVRMRSVVLMVVGAFAFAWTAAAQGAESATLTLGLVSETDQSAIESYFREFTDYVAQRVAAGPNGGRGRVLVAGTPFEMAKLLQQRRVDFYMESVYPTYTINYVHDAGKTILRRYKSGLAEYQSVIFIKRGGPIKRLDDLRGKTIVFEDPGSTSGFLMPKLFLQKQGLKLAEKRGFDPYASPATVAYIFGQSRDKMIDLVRTQEAAAGAFSDDDYAGLSEAIKSELTIIGQTERLPRHLVSVRTDLAPALVGRIEDVLLAMHEDPNGRKILEKIDRTTKFDRLPGGEEALRRRLLDTFFNPK